MEKTKQVAIVGIVIGVLFALVSRAGTPATSAPTLPSWRQSAPQKYTSPTFSSREPPAPPPAPRVNDFVSAQLKLEEIKKSLLTTSQHESAPESQQASFDPAFETSTLSKWQKIKATGEGLERLVSALRGVREGAETNLRAAQSARTKHASLLDKLAQDKSRLGLELEAVEREAGARAQLLAARLTLLSDLQAARNSGDKNRDLEIKLQASQSQLKEAEKKVEAKRSVISHLESKLEECKRAFQLHTTTFPPGAEAEITQQIRDLQASILQAREEVGQLEASHKQNEKKLAAFGESIAYLNKLTNLEGRVPGMGGMPGEAEIQKLKKELESLHMGVPDLDDEEGRRTFEQLRRVREEELTRKLQALEFAYDAVRGGGGSDQVAPSLLKMQQAAAKGVEDDKARITQLAQKQARLSKSISEAESRRQNIIDAKENKEKAQSRFQECSSPLLEQLEVARSGLDSARELFAKKQAEVEEARSQLSEANRRLQSAKTRIEALEAEALKLDHQIGAQEAAVVRAVNDKLQRAAAITQTAREVEEARTACDEANNAARTATAQIEALTKDINSLKSQLVALAAL